MTYGDAREALKMTPNKFRETVTNLPGWTDALTDLGLTVTLGYRKERVIKRR